MKARRGGYGRENEICLSVIALKQDLGKREINIADVTKSHSDWGPIKVREAMFWEENWKDS